MSLRYKYFAFILLLHLTIGILLYQLLHNHKLYFLLCEALLLLSLFYSFHLYRSFLYPIDLMRTGRIAIKEEDFTIKFNPTGSKETDELIEVYNSMIDSLRKERTRTEEQAYFLENLIEHSPIGMIIMDYDQKIEIINQAASKMLQQSETEGLRLEAVSSQLAKEITKLSNNEEALVNIEGITRFKCRRQELIHKGFPRQFVLIQELTTEILKAEKEAYGSVIRMMAHEVNNSTGAINSILQTIADFALAEKEQTDLRVSLQVAIDRNKSLGKFTNNFADVIRLGKPNPEVVDLNSLVLKMAQFYQAEALKANIEIQLDLSEQRPVISADLIQLEQVLSNVIKNAIESIEAKQIEQEFKKADLVNESKTQSHKDFIKLSTEVLPVVLTVMDNGLGIEPSTREHLFSPFFSTKAKGQGIGLMLCREVLNAHGASFDLVTDEHTGWTSFRVSF